MALPLKDFAGSRLRGYLGGLAAGALLQSASSVSSRLVSFAHGGLLAASAATAVMLGADLGRTLLPQALAFPITPAAPVLLVLGGLGLYLPRRLGVHAWGWVFLGAGLVLSGFWLLAEGADILQFSPSFRATLREWNYRESDLTGPGRSWAFTSALLLSAAAAFLLRSSNLPVALAIVLGEAGLLAPASALPVVLGANLGPALSIAASTIWRRREARRLGLMSALFQLVGLTWFVVLCSISWRGAPFFLHLADWTTPGLLFHPSAEQVGHHIAMSHTLYNLLNGLLCLSLARPLLRLVERLVPRDPIRDDLKPYHLDPNLIEVPPLALLQATREVTYLTEMCRKVIAESFDALRYRDLKLADQTVRREESIESVHRDVCQYLLRVGENELSRRESSRLQVLQAATGNLVRIGEVGERLRDLTTRELDEGVELPEDSARDLNDIYDLVMGQFDNVLQLLEHYDGRSEESAVKVTERLAKFGSRMEQAWFEKLRAWEQDVSEPSPLLPAKTGDPGAPVRSEDRTGAGEPPPGGLAQNGHPHALSRALLFREALEALFLVAGHLSHIAETMRVLSPKR